MAQSLIKLTKSFKRTLGTCVLGNASNANISTDEQIYEIKTTGITSSQELHDYCREKLSDNDKQQVDFMQAILQKLHDAKLKNQEGALFPILGQTISLSNLCLNAVVDAIILGFTEDESKLMHQASCMPNSLIVKKTTNILNGHFRTDLIQRLACVWLKNQQEKRGYFKGYKYVILVEDMRFGQYINEGISIYTCIPTKLVIAKFVPTQYQDYQHLVTAQAQDICDVGDIGKYVIVNTFYIDLDNYLKKWSLHLEITDLEFHQISDIQYNIEVSLAMLNSVSLEKRQQEYYKFMEKIALRIGSEFKLLQPCQIPRIEFYRYCKFSLSRQLV